MMGQNQIDAIGLCRACTHHRRIESSKGSVFYLCKLSEHDARFAKYPRLPIVHCVGYEELQTEQQRDIKRVF
jgi:hypothetical protein